MTLGDELRRKYALTSLKPKGECLVLLAINEALEIAAEIADEENSSIAASRIRSLKWVDWAMSPTAVSGIVPLSKSA